VRLIAARKAVLLARLGCMGFIPSKFSKGGSVIAFMMFEN
jgi:hypothetical protein